MKALALVLSTALLLGGCSSTAPLVAPPNTAELIDDALFKQPAEKIDVSDLFTVTPAMRDFMHTARFRNFLQNYGQDQGLVKALYDPDTLKIGYDTSITTNAADTFERRAGNCLSLAIMTASFAKELGLRTSYQYVMIDDTWTRAGHLYMSNMHVNLVLGVSESSVNSFSARPGDLIVDFLPAEDVRGFRVKQISEGTIVAMYLNNKAAEALSAERIDDAYWWARKAVLEHPDFITGMNTLGVIYDRRHEPRLAERAFRLALEREPNNLVVMYNLLGLLQGEGRREEAKLLAARVSKLQEVAPFHYFEEGMAAMESKDFKTAQSMFRREVDRAPYYDEFHYWLAVASYRLGELDLAQKELQLALKNSTTPDATNQYSAKLNHIRAMRGSDQ